MLSGVGTVASNRNDAEALLQQAMAALNANRVAEAEQISREILGHSPANPDALYLLAEVMLRSGKFIEGEQMLRQVVSGAPEAAGARHRLAMLLLQQNRFSESLLHAEAALKTDAGNLQFRELKASILAQSGALDDALSLYAVLIRDAPDEPFLWMRYGNALRAAGRREACIVAYRKAAELKPDLGEAWCSLANLKTIRFSANDIDCMETQLRRSDLGRSSRVAFEFALGKALGDESRFSESFKHYAGGSALWRSELAHNADVTSALVARCRALFTPEFFAERKHLECDSRAPIFIVGMPRAGSTLVEQILASHTAIEGLGELPDIMAIGARLDRQSSTRYPEVLAGLAPEELNGLGNLYLESTRVRRKQDRSHFTDKMPNNFLHIGLVHLILPNAKIVDVRRGAMACCFSNFTHHFARGQEFTYDLGELGRFHSDYVGLMDHYDRVLPGVVHRVCYETLVDNPEAEIRKLLAYLDLTFEESCLSFFDSPRAVSSASSEQVRLPLYRDALEFWRNYEPWLAPLKTALGPLAA
ncbi:MAG: tetratricopeptide repeat-containing sulfotransferase family protein [Alphaproteobacteria bacterium]|jgi:tetratricopeptide (TPR) repeat protein